MVFFNVKRSREYLLAHGHVYTLRRNVPARVRIHPDGVRDRARWGGFYKFVDLGPVLVEFVKKVSRLEDLVPYIGESGFATALGWTQAASPCSDNLLRVTLLKEGEREK